MSSSDRKERLLAAIDAIIEKHGRDNPQLIAELESLRFELERLSAARDATSAAGIALRVATLVKFFFDWIEHDD